MKNVKIKQCPDCGVIKPIDGYYKNGRSHHTQCKPCYNARTRARYKSMAPVRAEKKAKAPRTGFGKYPLKVRQEIVEMRTRDKKVPLRKIAEIYDINICTLKYWSKTGMIKL